jgi:hypothetical protein
MDYQTFWRTYFPEQELLSREQALAQTGAKQQFATIEELRDYQKAVAPVYGAYELETFQLVTRDKMSEAVIRGNGSPAVLLLSLFHFLLHRLFSCSHYHFVLESLVLETSY